MNSVFPNKKIREEEKSILELEMKKENLKEELEEKMKNSRWSYEFWDDEEVVELTNSSQGSIDDLDSLRDSLEDQEITYTRDGRMITKVDGEIWTHDYDDEGNTKNIRLLEEGELQDIEILEEHFVEETTPNQIIIGWDEIEGVDLDEQTNFIMIRLSGDQIEMLQLTDDGGVQLAIEAKQYLHLIT